MFSRSKCDFSININEPGNQAIFIKKIVGKFVDKDIQTGIQTESRINIMQCPNIYQCVCPN